MYPDILPAEQANPAASLKREYLALYYSSSAVSLTNDVSVSFNLLHLKLSWGKAKRVKVRA